MKWIAPFLLALAEKLFANSAVIIMSLIICLGMAYLADLVGLGSVTLVPSSQVSLSVKRRFVRKWNTVSKH